MSLDRHYLALEAADTGFWDLDVGSNACYLSHCCLRMLGHRPGELSADLEQLFEAIHPRDLEMVRRAKDDCIAGSKPLMRLEFRAKGRDGDWRWLLCKGKALSRDSSGKALRLLGTLVEVSEEKSTEQALRVKHDLLDLVISTSPVGIIFVGGEGQVAFANPCAEQMLGLSEREMMRRGNDSSICLISNAGNSLPERELPLREVLEAGKTMHKACFLVKRPDGRRVPLSIQAAPFPDPAGEVGGSVVILEDMAEQKQQEQVLAESNRLLHEAQRIAQLGSYVLNLGNDSWSCSEKLREILGWEEGFPLGLQGHFEVVHPDFRRQFMESYLTFISGSGHFEMEYKIRRQNDGAERWVTERCEVNRDEMGNLSRLIGTIQDITDRKESEEAIRDLNEDLDRRVMERTAELAAAKMEMESFAYSVSHDLRAPLRQITCYGSILIEERGNSLPDEARDYLHRICAVSSRMAGLIENLLRLSRVGRTEIKREEFDISRVAVQVAEMFRDAASGSRANFIIEKGLSAHGDSTLIRLVLENLLGNSLKYAGRKKGARIEFGETTECGKRVFFVRDDGVGFDMAYADKLFHPFQRLHGDEFEGTGIGLATVKRIVERHGGSIWAQGKENEGATFYFTLPGPAEQ